MNKWIKQNVTKLLKVKLNEDDLKGVDKKIDEQNQTKSIILRFRVDDGVFAYGLLRKNGVPNNIYEILNKKSDVDEVEYNSSFREPTIVSIEHISELDDNLSEHLTQISQR
jgi:hypothetical protein